MPVSAPPQHLSANLRVQCRALASSARDPWEDEAEFLAEWLAQPGPGRVVNIHPVPRDSHAWGTPIEGSLAARAQSHAGHPLDPAIRRDFESRLDRDLGNVRIHDDRAARDLAHSLGAEAFTLGNDIFTTRPDRELIAHEVVHAVQQQKAGAIPETSPRIQASFERTSAELDPKVEILLDLHLRKKGKQLKAIADDKLLADKSWWRTFRTNVEKKDAATPIDFKAEVENAVKEIGGYKSLDTAVGDPIQNGVAALLADYLRLNDAPELAAKVVVEYPWAMTALPSQEVANAIADQKNRGKAAKVALPRIWKTYKPKGAVVVDSWTKEITDAVDKFLSLTPLDEHQKQREALRDRLNEPLTGSSRIPDPAKALPPFDRLTDKSVPLTNELDEYASSGITWLRGIWASILNTRLTAKTTETSTTPIALWDADVSTLKNAADKIGTPADPAIIFNKLDWVIPVIEEAHPILAEDLAPVIQKHYDFWANVSQTVVNESPSQSDKYLQLTYGDQTYAQLFFAADQGALATQLQDIVQPLADAVEAYFDLFGTGKLPSREKRDTVEEVFARHKECADAFREALRATIQPSITKKLHLARVAGKAELAKGLGWFALKMERIHTTLEKVPALDDESKAETFIKSIELRGAVAMELWEIARDALGKTGADIYNSQLPPDQRKNVEGKANVPAGGEWQAIMDRAEKAYTLADIQTGLLLLRNPFQPSEKSDTSQLIKDAGGDVIRGLEPFTGRDLAKLCDVMYHRSLAEELTALSDEALANERNEQPRVKEDLWLVQKAYDALKAREGSEAMPQRYESRSVYWVPYAGDDKRAFGRLLDQQKAYGEFTTEKETRSNIVLSANSQPDDDGDAWAWTLPIPSELVAPLYQIPLLRGLAKLPAEDLNAALAARSAPDAKNAAKKNSELLGDLAQKARELGKKIPADARPQEGFYNWYQALNDRVRQIKEALGGDFLDTEATKQVRLETIKTLAEQQTLTKRDSDAAKRRATTLDRRVIARMNGELLQSAIDEHTRHQAAIGVALDNHDAFRGAVRPERHESEINLQSAALILDDADRWIEIIEDRPIGSYQRQIHLLVSEALETFPRLLKPPGPATGNQPADPAQHAEGIAWETDTQREEVAKKIERVTPEFTKALESMRAELLPYQWDLGITARKTQGDSAHAELFSHLAPSFPVKTIASIQAANAAEKNEEKRVPELIPIGGPLGLKIVNVHQDFTFLAGIGDRANAASEERGKHALYLPARLYLGVAASKPTDLANVEATLIENPKQSSRDVQEKGEPLVDVEIMEGAETFSKFTIYSGEVAGARGGLNWLAGVVHNTAAHDKFAAMAATVEGFGQLLILAASLYPPTAFAVTAAELSAFTLQLLADPEFKEALESISKDPIESVKHAASELKAQFTVGRLFDLLLNSNFEPDRFIGAATLRGKKRSNKLSRGRMAKVLTRLKRVGAVFAVRLEGFQESVQGPVHRIESLMGNHPRLATMVEWLGGHLKDLSDPEGMVLKHPLAGPIYEAYARYRLSGRDEDAASAIGQPLGDIAEHLQAGLDRMAHFELPATLIPLDLAIEALVDIALKLAPKTGKIGIARTLAQMLQEGLRATGANSVVYGFLAEQISNSWVDPNHYWKNDVVPLLEPPVKGAIQSAADSIGGHLSKAPLIGDYFGDDRMKGARPIPSTDRATLPNGKAAESAKIGVSDALDGVFESEQVTALVPDEAGMTETRELKFSDVSGMPDAFFEGIQKKPAAGPAPGAAGAGGTNPPAGSPSPMPPGASLQGAPSPTGHSSSAFASAGGAPLAPAQRREAEQKFGHDFSRVRLHQGPDAWAATGQRGADGLTSGSHVFLRPDLNPRSGCGQKVMEHELAHVLQKTSGPSTTSKPTPGGIRWKPSEESAANRMADRAQHNTTRRAISVEGAHREGASPSIGLDLMETFFKKLSSPSAGSSLAETIDRAHARKKVADVHPDSVTAANGLWDSIRANMRGTLEVASHFKASTAKIKEHLENRLSTITRDGGSVPAAGKVIDHLAAMSEKDPEPPAGGGKPAASGTAPAKAKPTFDARGFLADLSLYITGRSGIVFDFALSEAEVKRLKSDPNAKVTVGTKVKHIELLFVSNLTEAGLKLWETTIQNTTWTRTDDAKLRRDALRKVLETEFHAAAPSSTHTDATASAAPTATTEKAKEPAKGGDRGSYTPIWNTTKTDLALNTTYMEKVETQLQPAELSSDMMPSWGYYAVPATEPLKTIATSGKTQVEKNAVHWKAKIHKELTGGTYFLPENKRNSHHIVQYLLPEYFSNIKEFQPFPKLAQGKAYPGVKGTTTAVDSISGDGQSIGVSQTEAGRGNAMPAILLSASAHQNAGLHVTPKPDDTGKASQGYTIHREFRKFLAAGVTAHLGATREGDALDDYLVALGAGNANGQKAIVEAVRKTYAWIKDQNEQNLVAPEGMPGHEADFYVSQFRASAEAKKNFQSLTGQDYDTGSADIRTRIQTRIQAEAKGAMTDAIATLAQAPLGWKLPGA